MKGLKKGPELKMPDLKVPDFLKDLFYDLHDRRLLAPLALVVVAIAAVPFVLGAGSEDSAPGLAVGAATAGGEPEATTSAKLTVVEAKPGLRDYRKRLADREPTNPFKQRFTSPKTNGAAALNGGTDESSSEAGTVTTSSSSGTTTLSGSGSPSYTPPPSTAPTSAPPPQTGGSGKHHLTFFTWGIDVRISKTNGDGAVPDESQEPVVKDRVLPQTSLPGPKTPVVTYMGLSRKAAQEKSQKVLLLVSSDVKRISGGRTCGSTTPTGICELIEVKPGSPVTFIYGDNEVRYTIKVQKLELVVTGHA
jgi:hypothetical protein